MSRRERKRRKDKYNEEEKDYGQPPTVDERRPKLPRIRRRPETILIKVGEGKDWLQVYKELMVAKEILKESTGIRRTRGGDILIEMRAGSEVRIATNKLNELFGDKLHATALQDKVSVEIKEVDPLVSREELVEALINELDIKDVGEVAVKAMRSAPWGTQSAIIVLPKAYINKGEGAFKIRTGLTIATVRVLPNVTKCFRCHIFGHIAVNCKVVSSGKEVCRKCAEERTIL
jgi:hypothetical protein